MSWTSDAILRVSRGYQASCVLLAGAELGVFGALAKRPLTARQAAARLGAKERGMTVLLDALAAMRVLRKRRRLYSLSPEAGAGLGMTNMLRHQANCLRRWSHLAKAVKTGKPAPRVPSILGERGDAASFIGAMDDINRRVADDLVRSLKLRPFKTLLDIGGASGTWTAAFLRKYPDAAAVIFDLPHVIPMARKRRLARVTLVAGDFLNDPLPRGCDLAWLSAIVHQNSRAQNRVLFRKVRQALDPGGRLLIRDIVMEESRVAPMAGAFFAVNMLAGTKGGGTYTLRELREDLRSAGFKAVRLLRRDPGMHSVVEARTA
ncbi:MAG: methyltransferase [Elusimicrobiota bacterium]